jgi:tetratricopeptide (TPR) repeat protein/tRNA A-37 threonylcarbamoyl transferase component Bud32
MADEPAERSRVVRLDDGEVVAGRYRVVRYLARGGMGEVYEAEDLELGERVALKTIRAESRDRAAEEHFKREIQLSRKVTHANVCRIFDVGYHVRADGERVVFLTMELLLGETLRERVRRDGALPLPEAANLLRQIAAGLGAAHAAGVVHRDFKSANVIMVPRKNGALRAVVTDFGLAQAPGGEDRALGVAGGMVGTPGYMAPEQVEGTALSSRTDLYALGVVSFEMVTGQLPFAGPTPLAMAAKRLTSPAPSPRALRPELPQKWERAILACLERAPTARPATARAVVELAGLVTDSLDDFEGTVRVERLRRRVPLVRPATLLLVIALGALGFQRWRERSHSGVRRAIAAVPFHPSDTLTAEQPWIGEFAAELLSIRLGEGQALQSFDLSSVTTSLRDLGLVPGAELDNADLDRLRAQLTLDLVVSGRYRFATEDSALVVDAELRDARTHRRLAAVSERGSPEELAALLGRVADGIARAAGVSAEERGLGLGVTLPKRPAALRAFVEAREAYDRREVSEAVEAAKRGIVEEPSHARLHLLLAEASAELGDERGAAAEARTAASLAPSLPRREQVFVEAAAAALTHDRPAAIARYEQLRAEVPSDIDIGWRLVEVLDLAGRASDAIQVIERLRRERIPRLLGARLDLLEVDAREALGDLDRALSVAQHAGQVADELGARLVRANARFKECRVLFFLHRLDDARAACEATKRTAGEAGNRRLRATAVNWIANVDYAAGNLTSAYRGYEEILPLFRELGDRTGESNALNNLGNVLDENNDRAGAIKLWQASIALTDQFQDPISSAPTLENLCSAYQEDLDWTEAMRTGEKALSIWRGADEPSALVRATCRIASVDLDMGRGREADRRLDELEAAQARLTGSHVDWDCDDMRADLERGRGRLERALAILRIQAYRVRQAHQDLDRVSVGYHLGQAQAEAGDRTAALATLDELSKTSVSKSDQSLVRAAALLRLRLEAEGGKVEGGAARLAALESQLATETRRRTALATTVELERTRAALGDHRRAIRGLHELSDRAKAAGAVAIALEAQLYELEIAAAHARPPTRAVAAEYGQHARDAGRPGWADRVEHLAERGR